MALAPKTDWAALRAFSEAFARSVEKDAPAVFTSAPSKERRKGRIYLDYLRNYRGATAIASYSLRANPDFTVAAPVTWEELRTLSGPRAFDRKSMLQRLARLGNDPWEELELSASEISRKARLAVGMKM
jgi:bifunctional non-homologous end joining protein LigD